MDESLERLGYETALRALDKQEQLLAEVRTRTSTVIAISSVLVTFLGRPALAGRAWAGGCAIASFTISTAAGVYVLAPKDDLVFSLFGAEVYERFYGLRTDLTEIYRRLAYDLDRFWYGNDRVLSRLVRALRVAVLGLTAELSFLLVSITDTIF